MQPGGIPAWSICKCYAFIPAVVERRYPQDMAIQLSRMERRSPAELNPSCVVPTRSGGMEQRAAAVDRARMSRSAPMIRPPSYARSFESMQAMLAGCVQLGFAGHRPWHETAVLVGLRFTRSGRPVYRRFSKKRGRRKSARPSVLGIMPQRIHVPLDRSAHRFPGIIQVCPAFVRCTQGRGTCLQEEHVHSKNDRFCESRFSGR